MKVANIYNFKILLISALLVLLKYFVSYFLNYEEDLFFKILRHADSDFETYALITESLSRLDLKTDWSNVLISKKIIGFPFLALIWHAIFFNFFSYYGFIILEVIFYFLITFIIFKIFHLIKKNYEIAFFSIILLFLAIELLTFLSRVNDVNFYISNFFYVLLLPLNEFYGQRFPHPLVTSVYLFSFIYIVAKINKKNKLYVETKYAYLLGLSSIFLINSFFFHFVKASIFLLIFFIFKYKKDIFRMLKINTHSIIIYSFSLIVGFSILVLQLYFAEPDYSSRLGTYKINTTDKLFILQVLIKKLFQFEILIIIFLSFLARFNYKRLDIKGNDVFTYDLLFIFFISSLLSPYIFVILTSTSIYLYYFWSAIKFSGFLFIFAMMIKIFLNFKFNISIKNLSNFLCIIVIIFNFYNHFSEQKNSNLQLIDDTNDIQFFLKDRKYINSNKTLFSDDYSIMHLWLKLRNKNLIMSHGFVSSYSDELLEDIKFNYFKMINISPLTLKKILYENENSKYGRNQFARTFGYKYSVNSIRHEKPIKSEYSLNLQNRIVNISPLIQWNHFFSNSEKNRLMDKYENFKLRKELMPDILILRNASINELSKDHLISLNYFEIYSNKSFVIYELKI